MSVLGEVFDSLRTMTQWQLLLAFLACMGYALSQGRLIARRGRRIAAALALAAAIGFAFESADWANAAMLLAFAVSGLGLFVALTWLIARSLGLDHGTREVVDGDEPELVPIAEPAIAPARPRVAARPAHSH